MAEIPDFDQIAFLLLAANEGEPLQSQLTEQLRQVWNARGDADIAAYEAFISDSEKGGLSLKAALRRLDADS